VATPEERGRMNIVAGALDMLGLPKPDKVVPMPGDILEMAGIPTPSDIVSGIAGKVKSKVQTRRF